MLCSALIKARMAWMCNGSVTQTWTTLTGLGYVYIITLSSWHDACYSAPRSGFGYAWFLSSCIESQSGTVGRSRNQMAPLVVIVCGASCLISNADVWWFLFFFSPPNNPFALI